MYYEKGSIIDHMIHEVPVRVVFVVMILWVAVIVGLGYLIVIV